MYDAADTAGIKRPEPNIRPRINPAKHAENRAIFVFEER
jgi:hypothetical protein